MFIKWGVLEVVLPMRGANELPWGRKGLPGKQGVKLYRWTIKWNSFNAVFKDFPNTFRVPSTESFNSIASHKNAYFLKCLQNFLWRFSFLMQGNLWKIIAAYNFSRNAVLRQAFFCHILRTVQKDFRSLSKFFQSISTSRSGPFKFMHAFIYQMTDADFRPNSSW